MFPLPYRSDQLRSIGLDIPGTEEGSQAGRKSARRARISRRNTDDSAVPMLNLYFCIWNSRPHARLGLPRYVGSLAVAEAQRVSRRILALVMPTPQGLGAYVKTEPGLYPETLGHFE